MSNILTYKNGELGLGGLEINRDHHDPIENLPVMFHHPKWKLLKFCSKNHFSMSFHCHLDLGESDLEIDRDHSSPMDSLPMKFHHYRYKNSRVMLKKPFSMSLYLRPSLSQNDLEINESSLSHGQSPVKFHYFW